MDSGGNSGSMQSSSTGGGDEAGYDSSSLAFFHVGNGGGGVSGSGSGSGGGNSMQPPSLQQQQSSLFDSLSNFLTNDNHNNNNPFSTPLSSSSRSNQNPSSSSLHNLGILLQNPSSAIPRSQLNNFNSLMTSSSSPSPHLGRVNSHNPSLHMNSSTDHHQANTNNIQTNRNPKKRSRASRRAPTTVLTTDTSNFRAIVQEFTGIPTQPFTSSSSLLFPRSNRLDLFSNSSTTSTVRSGDGDSSFLLRPFAEKPIQVPPFLSSSTSSLLLNSNTSTANPNISSTSSSNSFQLLSEQLGFPSKNHNPSLIPYQSLLLQPNSSRNENNDARTNTSGGGGGVGLPNLVTSDGLIRNASWEDQDHLLRSLNGNYTNRHHQRQQHRVIMNADKGSTTSNKKNQNVSTATRGEGMVDSWICSSSE